MVCIYLDSDEYISSGSSYHLCTTTSLFLFSGVGRIFCSIWELCQTCQSRKSLIFLAHHARHTLLFLWDARIKTTAFSAHKALERTHPHIGKISFMLYNRSLKKLGESFCPLNFWHLLYHCRGWYVRLQSHLPLRCPWAQYRTATCSPNCQFNAEI